MPITMFPLRGRRCCHFVDHLRRIDSAGEHHFGFAENYFSANPDSTSDGGCRDRLHFRQSPGAKATKAFSAILLQFVAASAAGDCASKLSKSPSN